MNFEMNIIILQHTLRFKMLAFQRAMNSYTTPLNGFYLFFDWGKKHGHKSEFGDEHHCAIDEDQTEKEADGFPIAPQRYHCVTCTHLLCVGNNLCIPEIKY